MAQCIFESNENYLEEWRGGVIFPYETLTYL